MAVNRIFTVGDPRPGDHVRVIEGTFKGMAGVVTRTADAKLLLVLTIYGREVPVDVETNQVEIVRATSFE